MNNKPRLVVWLIIAVVIGYLAYIYINDKTPPVAPKSALAPSISEAAIVSDFYSMKNIKIPVKPVLGGTFSTNELAFSQDFKGYSGETFFASMDDGHIAITVQYRITAVSSDIPVKASYQPVPAKSYDFSPPSNYKIRRLEGQEITNP